MISAFKPIFSLFIADNDGLSDTVSVLTTSIQHANKEIERLQSKSEYIHNGK